MNKLLVNMLTPSIGAELSGIDFSQPMKKDDYDAIYNALIKYQVIFFRNQKITPEFHLSFAKSFGELEPPHPVYPHVTDYPEIVLLENNIKNPPDTEFWHTDLTFRPNPPFTSILYSKVIPPVGGDTLWSSMIAAYEDLPVEIKDKISKLRAIHDMSDFRNNFTVGEPDGSATKLNQAYKSFGSSIHPIVKSHPVNDKLFLYVNPGFTLQVVGMSSNDSRRLLNYLFDHINQPKFQARFKWTENTIAMWDNRCTMHCAVGDYLPHSRIMHRITVKNDYRAESKKKYN